MRHQAPIRAGLFIGGLVVISAAVLWPSTEENALKIASWKARYARPEEVPFPPSNRFSRDKYKLGKTLFFDTALSGNHDMSCATCHNPSKDWTDGLATAVGFEGKKLARKSPTLLNLSWGWSFFWDGRAKSLEEQVVGPIQNKDEMHLTLDELTRRLGKSKEYRKLFAKAFPKEKIGKETISRALATFVRTIVSGTSPFDLWIAGDESAISDSAKRGFVVFNGDGACVKCHTGWSFTNGSFADTGMPGPDKGKGALNNDPDLFFTFKTPTLRNIARRAPYMHDGSFATLEQVVEHYNVGGTVRRQTSQMFLKPLALSKTAKKDLISFLQTLTSEDNFGDREVTHAPTSANRVDRGTSGIRSARIR